MRNDPRNTPELLEFLKKRRTMPIASGSSSYCRWRPTVCRIANAFLRFTTWELCWLEFPRRQLALSVPDKRTKWAYQPEGHRPRRFILLPF